MSTAAVGSGTCTVCQGRGWVVDTESGSPVARPCRCRLQDLGPKRLAAAGIPERYRGCNFQNFKVTFGTEGEREQLQRALSVSQRYVQEFEDSFSAGSLPDHGLLFIGAPGVGKTHLAAAVLAELVRRCRLRALFVDFTSLLHEIQSTFRPDSENSASGLLHPVTRADLVVLDDLGAQRPSEWVRETLYLILNARYSRRLPTLFTTNYRLESAPADDGLATRGADLLERRLSPALVSRLYEMAKLVVIESSDFRQLVKAARHGF